MPAKQIIALATHHHVQLKGHPLNNRFGQVISLIRENYPVQIILEEWTPERKSFASTMDTDRRGAENGLAVSISQAVKRCASPRSEGAAGGFAKFGGRVAALFA